MSSNCSAESAGPVFRTGRSSDSTYRMSGGDIGWRKAEDLPSLFSDIAPSLPRAPPPDPIRSDSGFHLIFMEDVRGAEQIVAQTQVRHILIKPSEILTGMTRPANWH